MLFFLAAAVLLAALAMPAALKSVNAPTLKTILNGKWTPGFERNFTEKLAVYEPSRLFWGSSEYALFKDGRTGVVVGHDGWLFTAEEFQTSRAAAATYKAHLGYITETSKVLKDKDIKLAIALVPAKARLHQAEAGRHGWPAEKAAVYQDTVNALTTQGIDVVDLVPVLGANKGSFLKTDTHWSPDGARLAAKSIAAHIKKTCSGCLTPPVTFTSTVGAESVHDGDLLRYLPVKNDIRQTLLQDKVTAVTTESQRAEATGDSLFGDEDIPVVLVGTSYSANPLFNFAGFLRESLHADVLNAADEGLGPFVTMNKWRDSALQRDASLPKVVIWEIPERYLTIEDKK